jgi:hypothetical protein
VLVDYHQLRRAGRCRGHGEGGHTQQGSAAVCVSCVAHQLHPAPWDALPWQGEGDAGELLLAGLGAGGGQERVGGGGWLGDGCEGEWCPIVHGRAGAWMDKPCFSIQDPSAVRMDQLLPPPLPLHTQPSPLAP